METASPFSSARILTRHPPPPSSAPPPLPHSYTPSSSSTATPAHPDPAPPAPPSSSAAPQTPSPSQTRAPVGVVVVGFVGRSPDDLTPLINRVLDSSVFGSGNLDRTFCIEDDELRFWFERRRISYYHEEERGILYLQYCSIKCPVTGRGFDPHQNFDAALEEEDFGDLQGLLFMFSVCHVIIYVQEGSRFDTQILKKIRVLQSAKHALTSFVRSQLNPPLSTSSSSSPQPSLPATSNNASLHRIGGILSRSSSPVSLMSGLGSYTTLLPGRCIPVILFTFLDDFSDLVDSVSNAEDTMDSSAMNQSSSSSSFTRPSMATKGSAPVVVLSRSVNRSEVGFQKKLQLSLEAQIRFLIKKCRTVTGSEGNHAVSRNTGGSNPLFSLDASRCVMLLNRHTNKKGESLEFAIGLLQDVLNGKSSSDSLLHESHGESVNREDIQSAREFIFRQSDILRGRGGLVSNTTGGSAAGVGIVAAAAAAAAASAASRKTFTIPELPSLEIWLSSSQAVLQGLLSSKHGIIDEAEMSKRKSHQRIAAAPQIEATALRVIEPLEVAVSLLDSGKELNSKFSTSWCQRVLPAAKEVYLKDLPACYPTSLHEARLKKALHVFCSMVRGPAVLHFMKRLEQECISIWTSGRQQCDAVSLTGNPCLHQRHGIKGDSLASGAATKPHSSGFVFLHACACGRSRKLRPDPFDFESANIMSGHFSDCDKLLPSVQLPNFSFAGSIQASPWSLVRVGGARYYDSSTGLLQSGFSVSERFLFKWKIFLEKWKSPMGFADNNDQALMSELDPRTNVDFIENKGKKPAIAQFSNVKVQSGVENKKSPMKNIESDDKKIKFGQGFPKFTMKKPFSEVVAGSTATDSGFPPLHPKKQPSFDSEKGRKQYISKDQSEVSIQTTANSQGSQHLEAVASVREIPVGINADGNTVGPSLQVGSHFVPVNVNGCEKKKTGASLMHATVYVGFEHECPHGHRFLLTPEHLDDLGPLYSLPGQAHITSSTTSSNRKPVDSIKFKNGDHAKVHQCSNGKNIASVSRVRNSEKSKGMFGDGFHGFEGVMQSSGSRKEYGRTSVSLPGLSYPEHSFEEQLQSSSLDDDGYALTLLNRNLPIYMNCPHCRSSKAKNDSILIKFANSISQLQRIFMVTPPFPVVLGTCPAIQFEASCLPAFIPGHDQLLQFSLGCQIILPPESFLTLRLPFVYGVQLNDQSLHPLKPHQNLPELTAWINKGTTLQILSRERTSMGDSEYS